MKCGWGTMRAILGNQNVLDGLETLRTVFAEAVTILNNHPLTPGSDDLGDFKPLTLGHFSLQWRNLAQTPTLYVSEDLFRRNQQRQTKFLADCLRKRWMQDVQPSAATTSQNNGFERRTA